MNRNVATGIALLAALAWGTGNVAQKTILQDLDGWAANGIPSLVGAAVLLPLALREGQGKPAPPKGSLLLLLGVSLLFAFSTTVMQFSYGLTTVTNAGFLVNTAAVLTPVLAWAVLSQRLPLAIWPASISTVLGVFLMAGANWTELSPGDLLALLSATGFAVWTLAVGHYVVRTGRPVLMTVVQLMVSGGLCSGVSLALYGAPSSASLMLALPEILFIGLVSKGLAYVLMAISQQHLSATIVAVLVSAEAVFGAIIAALVLGEVLGPLRGVGSLFILLGVVIAARIQLPSPDSKAPQRALPP